MFKIYNHKGFTLMELIVSTSIIGILTVLFTANFLPSRQKNRVISAANQLATDIREVENYALSLKELKGANPPARGYLLEFSEGKNYVKLCYNNDPDDNSPCDASEEYKKILLAGNKSETDNTVVIQDVKLTGSDPNIIYIIFIPPDPTTVICHNKPTCDDNITNPPAEIATTTIMDAYSGVTKSIEINKFGLVDVVN